MSDYLGQQVDKLSRDTRDAFEILNDERARWRRDLEHLLRHLTQLEDRTAALEKRVRQLVDGKADA